MRSINKVGLSYSNSATYPLIKLKFIYLRWIIRMQDCPLLSRIAFDLVDSTAGWVWSRIERWGTGKQMLNHWWEKKLLWCNKSKQTRGACVISLTAFAVSLWLDNWFLLCGSRIPSWMSRPSSRLSTELIFQIFFTGWELEYWPKKEQPQTLR